MREITIQDGNIEEGYIHGREGRIWYRIAGRDRTKLPMLCVHGGPGCPHDYLKPLELLSDDRPVIFYDQLGCGNSEKPDRPELWTIDYFADEINEVRSALELDEFFYFGQSWGTMVGAYYLLNRTQKGVRAAVFGGPVMRTRSLADDCAVLVSKLPLEHREAIQKAEESGDYSSADFAAAVTEFDRRHMCRLEDWPQYVIDGDRKTGWQVYNTMWGPSEFICSGNLKTFDLMPRLSEINIPVLFTCGEFDECTPATVSDYHMAVKHSKLAVLADTSHMHHVEKPREYKELVSSWLGQFEKK